MDKFVVVWNIVKIFLIPLCIWYFERQVEKRDDKREKEYNARKRELDEQQRKNNEMQFLMMERIDNSAKMTHLMATKLHDAGIINGDLKELDEENKKLNRKYDENIRDLALEVLRSKR